jgi:predicted Rossmann-fold nucleotide-binding protein
MDEMFEFLTLIQTHKMGHRVNIFLYGSKFWKRALNFGWLLESGTIGSEDLKLIRFVDSPQQAFGILKDELGQRFGLRPVIKHPFI